MHLHSLTDVNWLRQSKRPHCFFKCAEDKVNDMKDRAKLRGKIIDILQDTDWSDQGIENMANKIIALRDDIGQREKFY